MSIPEPFQIDITMHGQIREQVMKMFHEALKDKTPEGVILLEGGKESARHDTDHEDLFRQESYFHYLFGVKEPNYWGGIDVATKKSILFIERLSPEYAIWLGAVQPPSYYKDLYKVDEVFYTDELVDTLKNKLNAKKVFLLKGVNTDSGKEFKTPTFEGINDFEVDTDFLFPVIRESRVFKTPKEIELLRFIVKNSSDAHEQVMRRCRPGMMEYQLEAIFNYEIYFTGGCRITGYTPICASGPNGAILHYGHAAAPNSKKTQDGELVVLDMGGELHGYGADITRTIPVNGKYSPEQKQIYNAVLAAQKAVLKELKEGVTWTDMHVLVNRIICEHLKQHGFLKGEVDDMLKDHIGALFMPHGLGHFLGIDTHDVGGYPAGLQRPSAPGLNRLRTARVLKAGMVITVEPGCYFIHALLEPAFKNETQAKYLVEEKIRQFWNFGGIRLEDNVVITKDGIDNLTTTAITCEDVEKIMNQ